MLTYGITERKFKLRKGYIRRSTKEIHLELAKRVADDEYGRYKT
mgnify:CR=1 FL=1